MSLFPEPPVRPETDPPSASLVQEQRDEERRQIWTADAARWRAGALAEAIFGPGVVPRLRSARGAAGFQALVELEVPFAGLDDHQGREQLFLAEARRDEILGVIPTLFVFTPGAAAAGAGLPG